MSDQKSDWRIVGQVATGFSDSFTVKVQPITWEEFLDRRVGEEEDPLGPISINLPDDPDPNLPWIPGGFRQRARTRKRDLHLTRLDRR